MMIANIWRKMIILALLERCFSGNPNASWQSISEHGAFFPWEPEFVMCQSRRFVIQK